MRQSRAICASLLLLSAAFPFPANALPWNVSGTVDQAGADLRIIVAVTDGEGHAVSGLVDRNFSASYALTANVNPGVFKGTIVPNSVTPCGGGCYSFRMRLSDVAHPAAAVQAAIVTVTYVGPLGSAVPGTSPFEQKGAAVISFR